MSSNLLTFPSSQPNTRTNYLYIRLKSANLNKLEYTNCTSLVLYGSNLGSTINIGRLPRNVQKIVSLPSQLYSIVVGILLSDGWLEKENLNANTRFRFKQVLARSDYIIYSFLLLALYCSSIPKRVLSLAVCCLRCGDATNTAALGRSQQHTSLFRHYRLSAAEGGGER